MAKLRINGINRIRKNSNNIHRDAESSYDHFYKNGKCYFQLDTYGSSDRENAGKVSQSIQLDKESAIALIDLLKRVFEI